ncbi:MAG TPA: hypothetical protein VFZ78_06360, partial [Flavisolibacter sp.]
LPADFDTYKYIDRIDKLVRKGNADPPIKGFSLTGPSNVDSTPVILEQPAAVLVFTQNDFDKGWVDDFRELVSAADTRKIPVYVASQKRDETESRLGSFGNVQFFNCDFTVVRTAARTDPTIYLLKKGHVVDKFSDNHAGEAAAAVRSGTF